MTAAPSELEPAPAGWVVRRAAEPGEGAVRIWGLAPEERLLRSLRRAGCCDPCIVDAQTLPPARGAVVALRADVVLDERLVEGLLAARDTMLVAPDLGPIGAHVASDRAPDACTALARADAAALRGVRHAGPPE